MPRVIARQAHVLLAGVSLTLSANAAAQVGTLLSVYTEYRFRGASLSGGRPVAIADLSYDLPNGAYAALSGRIVATRDEGVKPLGFAVDGGYAWRVGPTTTADLGVVHSRYSQYSGLNSGRSYTEIYAGLAGKLLGGRISVSPDYLGDARWTVYSEVDGHIDLSSRTVLEGNVGALSAIGKTYGGLGHPRFDARLGIGQRLGPLMVHGAITARGRDYLYSPSSGHHLALVIGVSRAL